VASLLERVKQAVHIAGRTSIGRNLVHAAVIGDPRDNRFTTVRWLPDRIEGFEDILFLFSSNQLNHGVISQELDEAALIYRLARGRSDVTVVDIGRFKGGSTFLLAAAVGEGSCVWSYDVHVAHDARYTGAELDRELLEALRRYGLDSKVQLVVADSRTVEPPPRPVDLILIDGDHSYLAVRSDWEHWQPHLAPGADVLFHDAVDSGGFGTYVPDVGGFVSELERRDDVERQANAGGIAHFVYRPATST
jgi:predicted O-methyltransferase YrrM